MTKQFHVYCYLFHYYFYVTHTTKSFTCYTGKQVRACFECIYNKLLIRKFDEDAINQKLSSSCQKYICYSSYYKKIRNSAKNCFQILKETFAKQSSGQRSIHISCCCIHCFRKIVLAILADGFYVIPVSSKW